MTEQISSIAHQRTAPYWVVYPTQELALLAEHQDACSHCEGGEFLREQGLHSCQMTKWRKLRDAEVLQGQRAGAKIGTLSRSRRK
ncbi:hypothetical protein MB46_00270 [Arthrobacter alpinus]|nr:hypothetical protein MB46_00270 [Arthrobacter alpinus]